MTEAGERSWLSRLLSGGAWFLMIHELTAVFIRLAFGANVRLSAGHAFRQSSSAMAADNFSSEYGIVVISLEIMLVSWLTVREILPGTQRVKEE